MIISNARFLKKQSADNFAKWLHKKHGIRVKIKLIKWELHTVVSLALSIMPNNQLQKSIMYTTCIINKMASLCIMQEYICTVIVWCWGRDESRTWFICPKSIRIRTEEGQVLNFQVRNVPIYEPGLHYFNQHQYAWQKPPRIVFPAIRVLHGIYHQTSYDKTRRFWLFIYATDWSVSRSQSCRFSIKGIIKTYLCFVISPKKMKLCNQYYHFIKSWGSHILFWLQWASHPIYIIIMSISRRNVSASYYITTYIYIRTINHSYKHMDTITNLINIWRCLQLWDERAQYVWKLPLEILVFIWVSYLCNS